MGKKKSFVFYYDWFNFLNPLSYAQIGKLMKALSNYINEGAEPDFDELALKIVFNVMKNTIERDTEKYYEACKKRSENGKKGAAVRWEENQ